MEGEREEKQERRYNIENKNIGLCIQLYLHVQSNL